MTIETGVVKGNIDRVIAELAEMLRSAAALGVDTTAIKQRYDALVLRAESFLKILQADDDMSSRAIKSNTLANDVAGLDTTQKDNAAGSPSLDVNDNVQPSTALVPDVTQQSQNSTETLNVLEDPSADVKMSDDDKLSVGIDSLQVQLSEIMMRLDELNTKFDNFINSDINEDSTVNQELNQNNPSHLIEEYISESGVIDDSAVRHVMETMGESVMQPSELVHTFWQQAAANNSFTSDQKKILSYLSSYQQNILFDKSQVMPSPWERGMKELFSK